MQERKNASRLFVLEDWAIWYSIKTRPLIIPLKYSLTFSTNAMTITLYLQNGCQKPRCSLNGTLVFGVHWNVGDRNVIVILCSVSKKGSKRRIEQTWAVMHKPDFRKLTKNGVEWFTIVMDPILRLCCKKHMHVRN
jgi:hypothetical protein